MFYLTTYSTHFIYGYMASDMVKDHIGYSYWLTARVLLYAPSHRQDNTYHSLYYTSRGALSGMRNSSMGPPHEGSIRPTAPWARSNSRDCSMSQSCQKSALKICFVEAEIVVEARERGREMFYLTMHSTHFIYGYMVSDIWLRTTQIVREETCCRHIGYSYWLTARVLLYAPSHRQDNTYHSLCYTSCGALAGTRNSSMGPPHEGSIRRPTAPWANALPLSYVPLPQQDIVIASLRKQKQTKNDPLHHERMLYLWATSRSAVQAIDFKIDINGKDWLLCKYYTLNFLK